MKYKTGEADSLRMMSKEIIGNMEIKMYIHNSKCAICADQTLAVIYDTSCVTLDLSCTKCGFRHIRISRDNQYKFHTFKVVQDFEYYNSAIYKGYQLIKDRLKTITFEFEGLGERIHSRYDANRNPVKYLDIDKQ